MRTKFNISLTEDEMILLAHITELASSVILDTDALFGHLSHFPATRKKIIAFRDKLELEDFL